MYYRDEQGTLTSKGGEPDYYEYVADPDYEKNTINQLFSAQVNQFNNAQKGNRNRILNGMYEHMESTVGKRGGYNTERELILAVGSKEDFKDMSDDAIKAEQKLRHKVIDKFISGFELRYPSIRITQAHLHEDERNTDTGAPSYLSYVNPHAHIDFVPMPVPEFTDKGKPKKPSASMNKALLNMFPNPENDTKKAFNAFMEDARSYIDEIALYYDPTHVRKEVGSHDYKKVNDYKEFKDRENALNSRETELDSRKKELDSRETELDDKDADVSQRLSNVKMREERVKDKEADILNTNLTVVSAIGKHYGSTHFNNDSVVFGSPEGAEMLSKRSLTDNVSTLMQLTERSLKRVSVRENEVSYKERTFREEQGRFADSVDVFAKLVDKSFPSSNANAVINSYVLGDSRYKTEAEILSKAARVSPQKFGKDMGDLEL
ncbi:hypothetical protein P7H94_13285 [Lactococcus lactis]|uniref:hypothetical protein n=1 Tax=Lactococcus lactis TaxID=1358 RepID=UPI00288F36A5|nr:hypothetical protein [Lactococcus lactis]MDT2922870.1 hypothetical protein [Lactococcus lactis]